MRILLADDDVGLRESLFAALLMRGHEVTEVGNYAEADDALREREYDVVITDFDFGFGPSGHLVAELAKQLSPTTCVILYSGLDREQGAADHFIRKSEVGGLFGLLDYEQNLRT